MTKKEIFESDEGIRTELIQAAKELGRDELKERLDALETLKTSRKPVRIWFAAAAMIVVLLAAVFLMRPPSSERLYSEFYTKFPNKVAAITRSDSEIDVLKTIMIAYEGEVYDGLVNKIKGLEDEYPQLSIYKAMVLLEEEEYALAIDVLQALHQEESYPFNEDAGWYLALSFIMTGEADQSKIILNRLIESSDKYRERARSIVEQL